MEQYDSSKLIEQLKRQEGFRAYVYQCSAGANTIGYGHNIDADQVLTLADFEGGVTKETATALLMADIDQARAALFFKYPDFRNLDYARQDALVNLCFNIGIGSFSGFKRMIRAIGREDFKEAAAQMLDSKWRWDVGPSRSGEVSRQLRTGVYA